MYSFNNDYSEGACDAIMEALMRTNLNQSAGYGCDDVCEEARYAIFEHLQCENCDIHFMVGGTQANLTVIASVLRPFEAVISVDSGHINVHETGAIEATGHKVVIAEGKDGKLTPDAICKVVNEHTDEHMVKPRMVYISNATELGTIYSLEELQQLRAVCDTYGLYLYMDGARLAMALVADENDVTLADIAKYCDVFYIGGTKCGALFGEAVVITNPNLQADFRYMIKQRGGMLAKGRLLGLQFLTLFQENRYFELAKHANRLAQKAQTALKVMDIDFFIETSTNQIFPIIRNDTIELLKQSYEFQKWLPYDDTHTVMRLVTSWATPEKAIDSFLIDCIGAIRKTYR